MEEEIGRIRMPKGDEVFGVILESLGHARFRVFCSDGRTRIARIPGSLKRKIWVKEGNLVLIAPWSVEGEEKGDLVWKYSKAQADWMKRKGTLKELEEFL